MSSGIRSNDSTDLDSDPATLSTSGSDTETSTSEEPWNVNPQMLGTPGLEPPPGLEPTAGGQSTQRKNGVAANAPWARKSFDAETKPSIPNAVGKKTSDFTECLRKISTSQIDAPSSLQEFLMRRLEHERSGSAKANLPQSLDKILSKLSPADAATVQAAVANGPSLKEVVRYPRVANITDRNTLRANLRKLANIDELRVFMVKRIGRLGFNSPGKLKTYFSEFGVVEHVFVTHGIDKRMADSQIDSNPRLRPASTGFVVMGKVDDVVKIFKQGLEHNIFGVCISVTAYAHHSPDDDDVTHEPSRQTSSTNAAKPIKRSATSISIKDNTLRSNLQKMSEIDAKRIFMVKRIGKLGFGSVQFLKTYFGQFGGITDVYVSHTFDKRTRVCADNTREKLRPGTLGFVVMDKAEDVVAIFEKGLEHVVYGKNVSLSTYEHHSLEEYASCDEEPDH
jgi:hypothetical protein